MFNQFITLIAIAISAQEPKQEQISTKISVKSGDLVTIAPTAGKYAFVWDKAVFPLGQRADLDGGKLRLTTPTTGKYIVTIVNLADGVTTDITITVTDVAEPAPMNLPPLPGDDTKEMIAMIRDIQKRLTALERGPEKMPAPPAPVVEITLKHAVFIGTEPDAALRKALMTINVTIHVLAKDDPDIEAKNMAKTVLAAGGPPCVILQDKEGRIISYGSVQNAPALFAKFIGK